MDQSILSNFFGEAQAPAYDDRWKNMSSINDLLHYLMRTILGELGEHARILCVGAGTGAELLALAKAFPHWEFAVVEPSPPMMDVCKSKAKAAGISDRCEFYTAFLETIPSDKTFDAATSILVSQFLTDPLERKAFFAEIAKRMKPGAILINADLASDLDEDKYEDLVRTWLRMHSPTPAQGHSTVTCPGWKTMVAVSKPDEIEHLIESAGFQSPIPFYQALFIRACYARI